MQRRLGSAFVVATLLGATGCNSAHITDAYISRDSQGHRISNCLRPTKDDNTTPNVYYVFVEMYSFKDDTLLTPVIRDVGSGNILGWDKMEPQSDELLEFGNIAPGKTGNNATTISWETDGPPLPNDPANGHDVLPVGNYRWEFYLNDHSTADKTIPFTIDPKCQ